MERSRKAQMQGHEREQDNTQALGAVAPDGDSKHSGGYPCGYDFHFGAQEPTTLHSVLDR